jgi:ABC-type glycerol-3-phosphate transport system permease component
MGRGRVSWARVVTTYSILIGAAIFFLLPLYWVFSTAFKSAQEAMSFPPSFIPRTLTLENFFVIFTESRTLGFLPFVNSAVYGLGTVLLTLGVCSLAGYAFSRYRFPGRWLLMLAILFLNMLPGLAKIIPLYVMFIDYHLYNTRLGLILLYSIAEVPLGTWLMKGYFDSIAGEVEEAAQVDGASLWQVLRYITLPLALPGLGAVAVVAFNSAWNQYYLPLILTESRDIRPYTVALSAFVGEYGTVEWHYIAAASIAGLLPTVLLFALFQRQFISGLGSGAVKG